MLEMLQIRNAPKCESASKRFLQDQNISSQIRKAENLRHLFPISECAFNDYPLLSSRNSKRAWWFSWSAVRYVPKIKLKILLCRNYFHVALRLQTKYCSWHSTFPSENEMMFQNYLESISLTSESRTPTGPNVAQSSCMEYSDTRIRDLSTSLEHKNYDLMSNA